MSSIYTDRHSSHLGVDLSGNSPFGAAQQYRKSLFSGQAGAQPNQVAQPLYVYSVNGNLVRVTGRDVILNDNVPYSRYEAEVLVTDDQNVISAIHQGTKDECRQYMQILAESLVILPVEVSSTPTRSNTCGCGGVCCSVCNPAKTTKDEEFPF